MDPIIRVKNLNKVFRIYDRASDRLREVILLGRKKYSSDFQALKSVSFDIEKGQFVGILGKNGAGKSTLLKILSGEITPTSGDLSINGRVALLQLGVGFDPELSGYDNAVYSSKIMGFQGRELEVILKKVEEFSELGEFFRHPVKTYSSGMYSRLSFATAVNVDPDILIADEVLSVGDMRFSQKCLRKMREFKEQGKTVILVTHDVNTVRVFCDTAIWLMDGEVFGIGNAIDVAEEYRNYMLFNRLPSKVSYQEGVPTAQIPFGPYDALPWVDTAGASGIRDHRADIIGFLICDMESTEEKRVVSSGEVVEIYFKVFVRETFSNPHFGWLLYDQNGLIAAHTNNEICQHNCSEIKANSIVAGKFKITVPPLNKGQYVFSISFGNRDSMSCRLHDVYPIEIVNKNSSTSEQCGYVLIEKEEFSLLGTADFSVKRNLLKKQINQYPSKRIIVGASGTAMEGWVPTDEGDLNLLNCEDWKFYFEEESLDSLLAEHVWEHLSMEDAILAAKNIFRYMKVGGYARVAVPDGNFPDQQYIDYVKPGGSGLGSDDHKVLFTVESLSKVFESAGFKVRPLEYFDKDGIFHFNEWLPKDGMITRSKRFDDRNVDGKLNYTSIIIDAIKGS